MINLPREDFKRAYSWFRSRLEEAVAAEDDLFRFMKMNKYVKFHYAVILYGFSAIVFVKFKKRASIPLAPCSLAGGSLQ